MLDINPRGGDETRSTEELVERGAIPDESRESADQAVTVEGEVLDAVLIENLAGATR